MSKKVNFEYVYLLSLNKKIKKEIDFEYLSELNKNESIQSKINYFENKILSKTKNIENIKPEKNYDIIIKNLGILTEQEIEYYIKYKKIPCMNRELSLVNHNIVS